MTDSDIICRIIKECGLRGVSRLKWKELDLEFHKPKDYVLENQSGHPNQLTSVANQLPFPWANQPRYKASKDEPPPKSLMQPLDEEALKEFEEFQLAIDDPIAYEEAQMRDDMEAQRVRGHAEATEGRGSEQNLHGRRGV